MSGTVGSIAEPRTIVSALLKTRTPEEARQYLAGKDSLTAAESEALRVLLDAQAQAEAQENVLAELDQSVAAEKAQRGAAAKDGWRSFDEVNQDIENSLNHVNPYTGEYFSGGDENALLRRDVLELRALAGYLPARSKVGAALPFDRQTLEVLKDKPYLTKAEQEHYDKLLAADAQGELRENWAMTGEEKTLADYMMAYGLPADTIRMYAAQAKTENDLSEMLALDYEMRQLNGAGGLGDILIGNFMAEYEMAAMGDASASPGERLTRMGEGKVPNPLMEHIAAGMKSLDASLSRDNQARLRGVLGVLDKIDRKANQIIENDPIVFPVLKHVWDGMPENWRLMARGGYHGLGPVAPDATDAVGGVAGAFLGGAFMAVKVTNKLDLPGNIHLPSGASVPDSSIQRALPAGDVDLGDGSMARQAGLSPTLEGQPADAAGGDGFFRNASTPENDKSPVLDEPWLFDVPFANENAADIAIVANGGGDPAFSGRTPRRKTSTDIVPGRAEMGAATPIEGVRTAQPIRNQTGEGGGAGGSSRSGGGGSSPIAPGGTPEKSGGGSSGGGDGPRMPDDSDVERLVATAKANQRATADLSHHETLTPTAPQGTGVLQRNAPAGLSAELKALQDALTQATIKTVDLEIRAQLSARGMHKPGDPRYLDPADPDTTLKTSREKLRALRLEYEQKREQAEQTATPETKTKLDDLREAVARSISKTDANRTAAPDEQTRSDGRGGEDAD